MTTETTKFTEAEELLTEAAGLVALAFLKIETKEERLKLFNKLSKFIAKFKRYK